jgi:hypothetical protein
MDEALFGIASLVVPALAAALGYLFKQKSTLADSEAKALKDEVLSIDEAILAIRNTGLSEEQKRAMYRTLIEKRVDDLLKKEAAVTTQDSAAVAKTSPPVTVPPAPRR